MLQGTWRWSLARTSRFPAALRASHNLFSPGTRLDHKVLGDRWLCLSPYHHRAHKFGQMLIGTVHSKMKTASYFPPTWTAVQPVRGDHFLPSVLQFWERFATLNCKPWLKDAINVTSTGISSMTKYIFYICDVNFCKSKIVPTLHFFI